MSFAATIRPATATRALESQVSSHPLRRTSHDTKMKLKLKANFTLIENLEILNQRRAMRVETQQQSKE